ncbi:hypothetical protein [Arsenophonus nasoniae]|uniref:Uncharacterized protein n=1 Tax=Arsenophonus nasoniae TaxID=638 RepID=A0AA95GFA7_9GAMM|nr:hypothetical protein [Arsenophonus nasoniae]WGL95983.1 hypothetical protein QE207_05195 [Arsenophonus nasoniae]
MTDKKNVTEDMIRQDHMAPKIIRPIQQPKSTQPENSEGDKKSKD